MRCRHGLRSSRDLLALLVLFAWLLVPEPALSLSGLRFVTVYENNELAWAPQLQISPDGKHLYTTGASILVAFERDQESGSIEPLGLPAGTAAPLKIFDIRGMAISPDGLNLYLAAGADDSLVTYRRDPKTGATSFVSLIHDGEVDGLDDPSALAVSPDGAHVYVLGTGFQHGCTLTAFRRDAADGSVRFVEVYRNRIDGVQGLAGPADVVVSPDGRYVYVSADFGPSSELTIFARSAQTGRLNLIGTMSGSPSEWISLEISGDGNHLFSSGAGVTAFEREAAGGLLSRVAVTDAHSPCRGLIGLDPGGENLYTASYGALCTYHFRNDTSTLHLTQALEIGKLPGSGSTALVLSPDGKDLYLVRREGAVAHFARENVVATATVTPTMTQRRPTRTPIPTVTSGGPTLTPTRTASCTATSHRPPLVARPEAIPDIQESGRTVLLKGDKSSGKRVDYGNWTQNAGGPQVSISRVTKTNASFIAPAVDRPTRLSFRLQIFGLGGSLHTEASASTSVVIVPEGTTFVTATAVPSVTPTPTRSPTLTRIVAPPSLTPTVSATPATPHVAKTPSPTMQPIVSATWTQTVQLTPTLTAVPTPSQTARVPCVGDCSGDFVVEIDEIVRAVNIALGREPSSACPGLTTSPGKAPDIERLIAVVRSSIRGCP